MKLSNRDSSSFDRLRVDLEMLSNGQWKDSPTCPDLGLPDMSEDELTEMLTILRPVLIEFGSVEWRNIVEAFLYLNIDQSIIDAIAERFPGMDRALEEDESQNDIDEVIDPFRNIKMFPGMTTNMLESQIKSNTEPAPEEPKKIDVNGKPSRGVMPTFSSVSGIGKTPKRKRTPTLSRHGYLRKQ